MMLKPVLITAPAELPVSIDEVKAHCRVDGSDDDAVLTALIKAAVSHLDGWTGILGRCLVTQTWRQDFADFGCMRLPLAPVASITSVTYYDAANAQQTLNSSVYELRTDHQGPYVGAKPDQDWPSVYSREDAVSVTFVAGADASDVPPAIKTAIYLLVSHWNENREAVSAGSMAEVPHGVRALLVPYRRIGI